MTKPHQTRNETKVKNLSCASAKASGDQSIERRHLVSGAVHPNARIVPKVVNVVQINQPFGSDSKLPCSRSSRG